MHFIVQITLTDPADQWATNNKFMIYYIHIRTVSYDELEQNGSN